MNNEEILSYIYQREQKHYEAVKEMQKTIRFCALLFFIAVVFCSCFYMYYVIPRAEEDLIIDGNSKVVMENNLSEGSNIWQLEEKE